MYEVLHENYLRGGGSSPPNASAQRQRVRPTDTERRKERDGGSGVGDGRLETTHKSNCVCVCVRLPYHALPVRGKLGDVVRRLVVVVVVVRVCFGVDVIVARGFGGI